MNRMSGTFAPRVNAVSARVMRLLAILVVGLFWAAGAAAQSTTTYVNSTDAAINGTTTCTAPLVRNFTVSSSFNVSDVKLGFFAEHTWRGDIRLTLQAPDGTRVQLVNGDINNISGDNLNVLLDDSASQLVNTDSATGNHSTANPPPFANTFRPNSALSAFYGKSAAGTWRLEICDLYPSADNGTFRHAELYLTSLPTNYADLSLSKSVSNSSPAAGATISYTLSVTNASTSPNSASGVTVRDLLPTGVTYVSDNGGGAYSSATGNWTVGTLTAGQTKTLTITVTVNASAGATVTNTAEVTASSITDIDSTPNNGLTTEDDYASRSFTVSGTPSAGTPPTLACTVGSVLQDWDLLSWSAGSTNNSYTITGIGSIAFAVTNSASPDATISGSPVTSQTLTGGYAPANNVYFGYDFTNRTDYATIAITLPTAVPGAQFQIYDVDLGSWADKITVTGTYNGATVYPTLTNGVANYVIGHEAYGSAGAGNTTADGNLTVTFQSPIDSITITYGNHSGAASNPGGQVIGLADITWCKPYANLSVTKISSVLSDPVNGTTNPKAIPGALVDYLITISNSGVSAADSGSVVISDSGPANAKLCFDANGTGTPVAFTDGSPVSGLTYSYISLGSTTDNLQFSNDNGSTWTYVPTADADGCDAAVTNFRLTPQGAFKPSSSFTLRTRYKIK